jgi:methylmalonyl-CoA mutase
MLFTEFIAPDYADWRRRALEELDGADFEKVLVWKTDENLTVFPLYVNKETTGLNYKNAEPGFFPYLRGFSLLGDKKNPPLIAQKLYKKNPTKANDELKQNLAAGQDVIVVNLDVCTEAEVGRLVEGIPLTSYPVFLYNAYPEKSYHAFFLFLQQSALNAHVICGQIFYDPIGELLSTGNIPKDRNQYFASISSFVRLVKKQTPGLKPLLSGGKVFRDAGADIVQELAYTISKTISLIDGLTEQSLSISEITKSLSLGFCSGTNLAFETAKLRAARLLWSTVVRQWDNAADCTVDFHLEASRWNKTILDPYVNVLRGTIESLAGYFGGVQSITLEPFDGIFGEVSERSSRLARNTQIILENESYLSQVIDPAAGSYYFEDLTETIAERAWARVLEIENEGGFLAAFEKGLVQKDVSLTASKRKKNIALRKDVAVGVNKYTNLKEQVIAYHKADENEPGFESGNDDFIRVEPLHPGRAVENLERIRLSVSALTKPPTVLLAMYGTPFWRRARATFSADFLGIAGFNIVETTGSETVEEAIRESEQFNAEIVVACSDDEGYPSTVPHLIQVLRELRPGTIVLVAGYPKDAVEALKTSGVDDFIHMKADSESVFLALLTKLGIPLREGLLA